MWGGLDEDAPVCTTVDESGTSRPVFLLASLTRAGLATSGIKIKLELLNVGKLHSGTHEGKQLHHNVQVWRAALGGCETLQVHEIGKEVLWVISALPPSKISEIEACTAKADLEILDQNNEGGDSTDGALSVQQTVDRASPASLFGYRCAVWMSLSAHCSYSDDLNYISALSHATGSSVDNADENETKELSSKSYRSYLPFGPPPCFIGSVHVLERHLQSALRDVRPSVSLSDLRRYDKMRDAYTSNAR